MAWVQGQSPTLAKNFWSAQIVETDFDISKYTSFKIGGKVKKVYFPKSVQEFVEILEKEPDAKVFGNLSNTLVSSKGYDGVVVLTNGISDIKIAVCMLYFCIVPVLL